MPARSRREFLSEIRQWSRRNRAGFDACAGWAASGSTRGRARNPLAPKPPHHKPTAKAVIWLFMEGGPSHIDLFDPKPELERLAGQPMPASFGKVITAMGTVTTR